MTTPNPYPSDVTEVGLQGDAGPPGPSTVPNVSSPPVAPTTGVTFFCQAGILKTIDQFGTIKTVSLT